MTEKNLYKIFCEDHYLMSATGRGKIGLFSFPYMQKWIYDAVVYDRHNLNLDKFTDEMIKNNRSREAIISVMSMYNIDNSKYDMIVSKLEERLKKSYYGIFAEALVYRLLYSNDRFLILNLGSENDYKNRIDISVKDNIDGSVYHIQVKTIEFRSGKEYYQKKLSEEKEIHKKMGVDVDYIYVDSKKFPYRKVICCGQEFYLDHFGRGQEEDFEKFIRSTIVSKRIEKELIF